MITLFLLLLGGASLGGGIAATATTAPRDWQAQLDTARRAARSPEDAVAQLGALLDALPLARSCRRRIARGGDPSSCGAPETPEEAEAALAALAGALDALGTALSAIPGREAEGIASFREAIVANAAVPSPTAHYHLALSVWKQVRAAAGPAAAAAAAAADPNAVLNDLAHFERAAALRMEDVAWARHARRRATAASFRRQHCDAVVSLLPVLDTGDPRPAEHERLVEHAIDVCDRSYLDVRGANANVTRYGPKPPPFEPETEAGAVSSAAFGTATASRLRHDAAQLRHLARARRHDCSAIEAHARLFAAAANRRGAQGSSAAEGKGGGGGGAQRVLSVDPSTGEAARAEEDAATTGTKKPKQKKGCAYLLELAEAYDGVAATARRDGAWLHLGPEDRAALGHTFNRALFPPPALRAAPPRAFLRSPVNAGRLRATWDASGTVMVVDDFLTPTALDHARRAVRERTAWHASRVSAGEAEDLHVVRAYARDGFAPAVALRVAAALPRTFPGVFDGGVPPLAGLWAERYIPFDDDDDDDDGSGGAGRRHSVAVGALRAGVSCVLLVAGPDDGFDASNPRAMAWAGSNRLVVLTDGFWQRVSGGGEGEPVASVRSQGGFKKWTASFTFLYGDRL